MNMLSAWGLSLVVGFTVLKSFSGRFESFFVAFVRLLVMLFFLLLEIRFYFCRFSG